MDSESGLMHPVSQGQPITWATSGTITHVVIHGRAVDVGVEDPMRVEMDMDALHDLIETHPLAKAAKDFLWAYDDACGDWFTRQPEAKQLELVRTLEDAAGVLAAALNPAPDHSWVKMESAISKMAGWMNVPLRKRARA